MSEYRVELVISGADEGASAVAESVAKSLTKIEDSAKRVSANASASLSSFMGGLGGALQVATGNLLAAGVSKVAELAHGVVEAGFSFDDLKQRASIAFETMLGSADKARSMVERLRDFAASTPFEFPDLITGAQRLLAMNFRAEEIIPTLRAVGDAAAGLGGSPALIDQITRAMGQMRAKGKVMAGEMLQLTEAGIPAWQMLADKIGVSVPQAMAMAEKGLISADSAIGALVDGMNAKFGGLMEKQAHTWQGVVSTLKDNLTQAAGIVVEPFFNMATKAVDSFNGVLSSGAVQKGLAQFSQTVASGLERGITLVVDTALPAVRSLIDSFANSNLAGALQNEFNAIANAVNGSLLPALQQATGWISTNLLPALMLFANWLGNTVLPALVNLAAAFYSTVIPAIVQFGQIVGPILGATLMAVIAILRDQVGPALQKIGDVLNTVVFPALKVFLDWVGPKLTPILQTAAQLIGIVIVQAVQNFATQLSNAANSARAFAQMMGDAVRWVIERIADLIQKVGELKKAFGDIAGGNELINMAQQMREGFQAFSESVNLAQQAASDLNERVNEGAIALNAHQAGVLSDADALRQEQLEARRAAQANKDFGNAAEQAGNQAMNGANAAQQAADIMSKVADKVRGMVEQALNPTTVDQRLQMTGNAWDEFRLRLEAVNSGTPLDQYGAAFVAQVQKMQQITGLALPDIAAKFKDFSLFANMDWLKGALESGAIDLEPIKARINEQIQQIIGQANLMKAAFDEVWSGLAQQTKLDLANALGLSPQAANNATQVFQALSGTQAQTAATTVQGTATATSALNSALTNTQALTNNVATALGNVPAKMLAVQNAETPFRETTLKLNDALSINNAQLKSMFDYLEKARGSMAQTPAALTALTTAFTDASTPMQAFNDNTLRPIANTLGAILEYMRGIIAAAPDFGDALSNVDVDSAIKPGSPSPLEITLGHILGHMEDIASVAPRTFSGAVPPPFGFNATENVGYNGAVNGGSAGRQIVFTGNIYVQNPANFDAFMEEINRRVDTIVVNGD